MNKPFEDKVVVVTGANSGIGEAAAIAFHEAGARVYGFARRPDAVGAAREKHSMIHWILADVANEAQATQGVEAVVREAGRLDILVNNAGVGAFAPLEQSVGEVTRTCSRRR
jgi:NAD(P)-dependent dehydrogenase (short-subunit alcohol dehydrogenase family)